MLSGRERVCVCVCELWLKLCLSDEALFSPGCVQVAPDLAPLTLLPRRSRPEVRGHVY